MLNVTNIREVFDHDQVHNEAIMSYQLSCTQVTLEGKNCNLETKDNLETAKFRGLEYFHNPNT